MDHSEDLPNLRDMDSLNIPYLGSKMQTPPEKRGNGLGTSLDLRHGNVRKIHFFWKIPDFQICLRRHAGGLRGDLQKRRVREHSGTDRVGIRYGKLF